MNTRALATILAACISVLALALVLRTGIFVSESLLPLYEGAMMQVEQNPL